MNNLNYGLLELRDSNGNLVGLHLFVAIPGEPTEEVRNDIYNRLRNIAFNTNPELPGNIHNAAGLYESIDTNTVSLVLLYDLEFSTHQSFSADINKMS